MQWFQLPCTIETFRGSMTPIMHEAWQKHIWWTIFLRSHKWETSQITSAGLSSVLRCIIPWLGRNQPDKRIGGAWLQDELALHINCLELHALATVQAFCQQGKNVYNGSIMAIDNTTAGIHQSHGCSPLPDISTNSHSNVEVGLTPGNLSQSSAHSRSGKPDSRQDAKDNRTDWQLNPAVLSQLNQLWRPLQVDLFKTRL